MASRDLWNPGGRGARRADDCAPLLRSVGTCADRCGVEGGPHPRVCAAAAIGGCASGQIRAVCRTAAVIGGWVGGEIRGGARADDSAL